MAADSIPVDDLLKHEGNKGWKLDLFKYSNRQFTCSICHNICRDAVELSCDEGEHEEEDTIRLYCHDCLHALLHENGNKCPVSGHEDASFVAIKSSRKMIMKMKVFCPNSKQYKEKNNFGYLYKNVVDTKEGMNGNDHVQNVQGCDFEGTLKQLLQEHVQECVASQPMPQHLQSKLMQSLKHEVAELKQTNVAQQQQIEQFREMIKTQQTNIRKLEQQSVEQSETIKKLEKMIVQVEQRCGQQLQAKQLDISGKIDKLQKVQVSLQRSYNTTHPHLNEEEKQDAKHHQVEVVDYKEMFCCGSWHKTRAMHQVSAYKLAQKHPTRKNNLNINCFSSCKARAYLCDIRAKKVRWKIKITATKVDKDTFVGVVSDRCTDTDLCKSARGMVDAYGITGRIGFINGNMHDRHIARRLKGVLTADLDSIIEIEFDWIFRTLRFKLEANDKPLIINLPEHVHAWFPAVSLRTHGNAPTESMFELLEIIAI